MMKKLSTTTNTYKSEETPADVSTNSARLWTTHALKTHAVQLQEWSSECEEDGMRPIAS